MDQTNRSTLLQRAMAWRDRVLRAFSPEPPPVPDDWFTDAEIAGYDDSFAADDPQRIDDATWRDLEAKTLLRRLSESASIHARQYLFQRLRRGATFERGARPSWMGEDAEVERVLAETERARLALRREDMEATGVLFHGQLVAMPAWLRHLRWAKTLWMAGLVLALAGAVGLGALLAFAYLVVWAAVEVRFHARLQRWTRQRRMVLAMLRAVLDLGTLAHRIPHPVLAYVGAAADDARRLLAALDLDAAERTMMSADYLNLLTLQEYVAVPTGQARLEADLPALRALYAALAECDGRLCLMAWLRQHDDTCWAQPSDAREMRFIDLRNPLLVDAQPLSLELRGEGAFVSGENGIGKSTLLRSVGLNLLLARAFGFCHAAEAALPPLPVWSSMVHEDSMAVGDSLYMAEMRRAQTLLRVAEGAAGAVFLIDEIFRGTNHVESVAGAAAVLNRLASAGLVIVSSHNVVLAPLLRARLAPRRVVRAGARGLALEAGVLQAPNGLAMMRHYAIPDAVRDEAQRVHDWFARHVATPVAFPPLA